MRAGAIIRHSWWLTLALALTPTLVMPKPVGADTVNGYVIDADQNRVSDVEVAFLVSGDDSTMTELVRTRSDQTGHFEFSGPFLTAGTRFALTAYYHDVPYPSSALSLGEQDQIIIEVFETVDDASQLQITSASVFLGVTDRGLEVAYLVQVENGARHTYVGAAFDGHPRGLEFNVPAGLTTLTAHTGELIRLSATRVFDTQPLPPGPSQVAFTFLLPADVFAGSYVHEVIYPTQHLDLFIQPTNVDLGAPYEDLGQVTLHDQQYRHYRAHQLVPGQRLEIDLPYGRPMRWILKWALMALMPAMALAALLLTRHSVATVTSSAKAGATAASPALHELEATRQRLLTELAQVQQDRLHARGEQALKLESRQQQLMAQARNIYRQLPR